MRYIYEGAVYTDAGKKNNEDSKLLRRAGRCFAAIIADGVGGLDAGEIASGYTVKALSKWFDQVQESLPVLPIDEIQAEMNRVVMRIHEDLLDISEEEGRRFGSTLTFALLTREEYLIAQVGDSRAYIYEEGSVSCITEDQTVAEYERKSGCVIQGVDEAKKEHTLLQCLGQREIKPVYYKGFLPKEYQFLVCSDGLSNTLTNRIIARTLEKPLVCKEALQELTNISRGNGEGDNITSVLVRRSAMVEEETHA